MCFVINRGSWDPNGVSAIDQKRLKEKFANKETKRKEAALKKPEWLKEWTISKGWVHNKSHLLELGRKRV
ncbi:unnamed protein product [Diabrotica balteata]|uniref:Uncharacterized protein n=1 Tax=Diabrotica balteata TaxID=107213 RepID=A0A9N9STK6_DIABA|nr:unnamed protein product [Diabrotica balteata]